MVGAVQFHTSTASPSQSIPAWMFSILEDGIYTSYSPPPAHRGKIPPRAFVLISCLEHLVTVAWFREAPGKAGHNPRNAAEQKGNIVRR